MTSESTISALTAFAVLWHALVGCCVHHGHSENASGGGHAKVSIVGGDSCVHDHACAGDQTRDVSSFESNAACLAEPRESPCGRGCDGETCVFDALRPSMESLIEFLSLGVPGIRQLDPSLAVAVATQTNARSGSTPIARPHLVFCVLLI